MKQKLFLTALLTLTLCTSQMWASEGSEGTTITIYAVGGHITWKKGTWDDETSTLKIDCRRKGNENDFSTPGNAYLNEPMTNTTYTYCGHTIYSYTFKELYDGAQIRLKHYKNGEFQEDYTAAWAGTSTINGKIYDGYYNSAHQWLTYGRDITIYAIPESSDYNLSTAFDPDNHNLRANVKVGSTGSGEWLGTWPVFDKTSYKYKGNWIYKATVFAKYNVIVQIQFTENDGSSNVCYYDFNPASEYSADDLDGKIFAGWVNGAHTWIPYARDYAIYYDMNGGDWKSGWIGTRTYGAGDVALSSDVTKTDYNFAGWYDNSSFEGGAITSISSTLDDDITLYAKWADFSKTTLTPALNPFICTASAGDVVVVTVSATQSDGAYIQLEDKDGVAFGESVPVSTGTYAIPLTAADAAKVNAGLVVSGSNCTVSDVTIKYQQTLWTGTVSDNTGWTQSDNIGYSIFAGLSAGDFLGVYISAINDGASWHQYALRANYVNQFSGTLSTPSTKTHQLTSDIVTVLKAENVKDIAAQYLDVSALYTYIDTKDYTVTLNTNDGTVNAGNITEYTYLTGATLPTDVSREGYTFDGWYDNSSFTGSAITAISTSDYGNKEYWAKWTSIQQTFTPSGSLPISSASEGDLVVVTVSSKVSDATANIVLQDKDGGSLASQDITSSGEYVFLLSAAQATKVNAGLILTGTNYTGSVDILFRNTIWDKGIDGRTAWAQDYLTKSIFTILAEGYYLGVNVNAIKTDVSYWDYQIQAADQLFITNALTAAGTYLHKLTGEQVTTLKDPGKSIKIASGTVSVSAIYTYLSTRNYTVTLNTNNGTINSGNVTSYMNGTGTTLPDDITREDYTFGGWYDNSSFVGSAVTVISTSDYGDKEYWAKWTATAEPESDQTWAALFSGNEPTINDNIVLNSAHTITVGTGTTAYANQVTLKNDAKLVIEDGAALIIRNGIDNNGSSLVEGDLTLGSSLENGNATLIYDVTTGLNATVEMASKATTTGGSWTWQYVGVPVAGVAENLYSNGYMYKWNNGWSAVRAKDNLEAFAGYCVTYSGAGHVFEMGGALTTTTSKTINVAANTAQVIGNSWTAPIQIKQMDSDDFDQVEQTIYLFNTGSDVKGSGSEANSSDRYAAGTYITIPIADAGISGLPASISALQGFFVKNETKTDGSITLSYSKHVRPTGENSVINGPMHAPKRITAEDSPMQAVAKLTVSGTRYDDQLVLIENDNCSAGFDNGWDGEKIGESSVSPWIYALRADGTHDAVSATDDLEGAVIGFRAGEDTEYTIHFDYSEEAEEFYLYDVTEKQATRVLTDNTYTFTTTDKEEHARFTLLRANAPQIATGMENVQSDDVQCTKARKLMLDGQLYLMYKGTMYNVQGAVMK